MELSRTIETETGEMIVKRVSVPLGLEELMEGLAKDVILKKPKDIYVFASEYFTKLLHLRDSGLYRGNVRSAKLAVKQPSKAVVVGHKIFSPSDPDFSSKKNIERKPSTPYYLNHSDGSAKKSEEMRRSRIREHLRMKKEDYGHGGNTTSTHSGIEKENSVKSSKKDIKLMHKSRPVTRNRRSDSENGTKLEKKSYERTNSLREGTRIKSKYRDTSSSKQNKQKNDSSAHSENFEQISPKKKSSTISSTDTGELKNCSLEVAQNTESIKKLTTSMDSDNANNKAGNISSTQDEKGHYEVSYNPELLASDREDKTDTPSFSIIRIDSKITEGNETNDSTINNENMDEEQQKSQKKELADVETVLDHKNANVGSDVSEHQGKVNVTSELEAAILIQSLWRGFQSRKKTNDNPQETSSTTAEDEEKKCVSKPLQKCQISEEQTVNVNVEIGQTIREESEEKKEKETHNISSITLDTNKEDNQKNETQNEEIHFVTEEEDGIKNQSVDLGLPKDPSESDTEKDVLIDECSELDKVHENKFEEAKEEEKVNRSPSSKHHSEAKETKDNFGISEPTDVNKNEKYCDQNESITNDIEKSPNEKIPEAEIIDSSKLRNEKGQNSTLHQQLAKDHHTYSEIIGEHVDSTSENEGILPDESANKCHTIVTDLNSDEKTNLLNFNNFTDGEQFSTLEENEKPSPVEASEIESTESNTNETALHDENENEGNNGTKHQNSTLGEKTSEETLPTTSSDIVHILDNTQVEHLVAKRSDGIESSDSFIIENHTTDTSNIIGLNEHVVNDDNQMSLEHIEDGSKYVKVPKEFEATQSEESDSLCTNINEPDIDKASKSIHSFNGSDTETEDAYELLPTLSTPSTNKSAETEMTKSNGMFLENSVEIAEEKNEKDEQKSSENIENSSPGESGEMDHDANNYVVDTQKNTSIPIEKNETEDLNDSIFEDNGDVTNSETYTKYITEGKDVNFKLSTDNGTEKRKHGNAEEFNSEFNPKDDNKIINDQDSAKPKEVSDINVNKSVVDNSVKRSEENRFVHDHNLEDSEKYLGSSVFKEKKDDSISDSKNSDILEVTTNDHANSVTILDHTEDNANVSEYKIAENNDLLSRNNIEDQEYSKPKEHQFNQQQGNNLLKAAEEVAENECSPSDNSISTGQIIDSQNIRDNENETMGIEDHVVVEEKIDSSEPNETNITEDQDYSNPKEHQSNQQQDDNLLKATEEVEENECFPSDNSISTGKMTDSQNIHDNENETRGTKDHVVVGKQVDSSEPNAADIMNDYIPEASEDIELGKVEKPNVSMIAVDEVENKPERETPNQAEASTIHNEIVAKDSKNSNQMSQIIFTGNKFTSLDKKITNENDMDNSGILKKSTGHSSKAVQIYQNKLERKDKINTGDSPKVGNKESQNKFIKKRSSSYRQETEQIEKSKNNKMNIRRVKSQESTTPRNQNRGRKNSVSPEKKFSHNFSKNSVSDTVPHEPLTEPATIQKNMVQNLSIHGDRESNVNGITSSIDKKIISEMKPKDFNGERLATSNVQIGTNNEINHSEERILTTEDTKDITEKNDNDVGDTTFESSITKEENQENLALTQEKNGQFGKDINTKSENVVENKLVDLNTKKNNVFDKKMQDGVQENNEIIFRTDALAETSIENTDDRRTDVENKEENDLSLISNKIDIQQQNETKESQLSITPNYSIELNTDGDVSSNLNLVENGRPVEKKIFEKENHETSALAKRNTQNSDEKSSSSEHEMNMEHEKVEKLKDGMFTDTEPRNVGSDIKSNSFKATEVDEEDLDHQKKNNTDVTNFNKPSSNQDVALEQLNTSNIHTATIAKPENHITSEHCEGIEPTGNQTVHSLMKEGSAVNNDEYNQNFDAPNKDNSEHLSKTNEFDNADLINSNESKNESEESKNSENIHLEETGITSREMKAEEIDDQARNDGDHELPPEKNENPFESTGNEQPLEDTMHQVKNSLQEFIDKEKMDSQESESIANCDNHEIQDNTEKPEEHSFIKSVDTENIEPTRLKSKDDQKFGDENIEDGRNIQNARKLSMNVLHSNNSLNTEKLNSENPETVVPPTFNEEVDNHEKIRQPLPYAKLSTDQLCDEELDSEKIADEKFLRPLNKPPQQNDKQISFNKDEIEKTEHKEISPDDTMNNWDEIQSAINIQKTWRGFQARKKLGNILDDNKTQTLSDSQGQFLKKSETDENRNIINSKDKNLPSTGESSIYANDSHTNENDTKKKSFHDANEEEITKAALKIQGTFRKFKTRRGKKFERSALSHMDSNTAKDYVNQALKIQTAWRAYKVRKNIREVEEKINEIENNSGNKLPKSIHLTDEEILKAVTKIQTNLRGYMARKHFKNLLERNQSLDGIQEETNCESSNVKQNVNMSDEEILNTLKQLDAVIIPNSPPEVTSGERIKRDTEYEKKLSSDASNLSVDSAISENSLNAINCTTSNVLKDASNINPIDILDVKSDNLKSSNNISTHSNEFFERNEIDSKIGNENESDVQSPISVDIVDTGASDRSGNSSYQQIYNTEAQGSLKKSKATDDLVKLAEEFENGENCSKEIRNTLDSQKPLEENDSTQVSDIKDYSLPGEKLASFEIPDSDVEDSSKILLDQEIDSLHSEKSDKDEVDGDDQRSTSTADRDIDNDTSSKMTPEEIDQTTTNDILSPQNSSHQINSNKINEFVNRENTNRLENSLLKAASFEIPNSDVDLADSSKISIDHKYASLHSEKSDTDKVDADDRKTKHIIVSPQNVSDLINFNKSEASPLKTTEAKRSDSTEEDKITQTLQKKEENNYYPDLENNSAVLNDKKEITENAKNGKITDSELEQFSPMNENIHEQRSTNVETEGYLAQDRDGMKKEAVRESKSEDIAKIVNSAVPIQTVRAVSLDHENEQEEIIDVSNKEQAAITEDIENISVHPNDLVLEEETVTKNKNHSDENTTSDIQSEKLTAFEQKESDKINKKIENGNQQNKRLTLNDFMKKTLNIDQRPPTEEKVTNNENSQIEIDSNRNSTEIIGSKTKIEHEAAVKIQSLYRGYRSRKETKSSTNNSDDLHVLTTEFQNEKDEDTNEQEHTNENSTTIEPISAHHTTEVEGNLTKTDHPLHENSSGDGTPEKSSSVAVGIQTNVPLNTNSNADEVQENVPVYQQ